MDQNYKRRRKRSVGIRKVSSKDDVLNTIVNQHEMEQPNQNMYIKRTLKFPLTLHFS